MNKIHMFVATDLESRAIPNVLLTSETETLLSFKIQVTKHIMPVRSVSRHEFWTNTMEAMWHRCCMMIGKVPYYFFVPAEMTLTKEGQIGHQSHIGFPLIHRSELQGPAEIYHHPTNATNSGADILIFLARTCR